MNKPDYISGTEDAYVQQGYRKRTVRVSSPVESEKSIGVLVDLVYDEKGIHYASGRKEWFPKSLCSIESREGEYPGHPGRKSYYLTAPEWLLIKNNVKYTKQ